MNHQPIKPLDFPQLSRRQLLISMAASAAVAAIGGCASNKAATTLPQPSPLAEGRIQRAVAPAVQSFDLKEVRLLDGPFLDAQKRDEKYLLSLEPDRMLANFRTNAGLQPKAPVYGGWESVQTWADIRAHGHTLGHYLTACALMYASTGDKRFKDRCDYIVADLQDCQNAGKTGVICAFPDKTAQFENAVAGRRVIGVPWYTTHKVMAGLRDAYIYCDNKTALEVLVKFCDWTQSITQNMSDAAFQRMLNTEHGGMNEVLADVYVLTGDEKYLNLSQRFCHLAVLDPLAGRTDRLNGLHSNTQIPKIVGFERLYTLTGQDSHHTAADFFWQTIVNNRSFVTGGNGDNEHFFPPADFARHLTSAKTMETCCSHNMLRLTRALFEIDPVTHYADYYERTLYNCILASQDPDSGMMTYFQPTRPGYFKPYCTPIDSFWCCTGTGMENHAKYGDSIYFHSADALYVNLFIPSRLDWKAKRLTLTQATRFPDESRTSLQIKTSSPTRFALNIRHPGWCKLVTVKVNGAVQTASQAPGSYIVIDRTWRDGDRVEVELPMTLRSEFLPGSADTVAMVYGPIVLAGKLGRQGLAPGEDIVVNERTIGTQHNDPIDVPALAGEPGNIVDQFNPSAGESLTFSAPAAGRTERLSFVPYFRIAHERYSLYWKCAHA
ncbi:MAG TPA: beta-L-arabinofuranosidase domain-containing protein [Tepidisphaeraceae bacterium]|nr:beta-L-arabinofuranosidase domain-containing protein [Tepidisphaeraceae bacterium]